MVAHISRNFITFQIKCEPIKERVTVLYRNHLSLIRMNRIIYRQSVPLFLHTRINVKKDYIEMSSLLSKAALKPNANLQDILCRKSEEKQYPPKPAVY